MGKEEETAREAVGRIRSWLGGNPTFGREGNLPRLTVKFCGGCNPHVDRGSILQNIRERLGGRVFWVAWGEKADLLLILNGCPVSCAEREDVKEKSRWTLMISGNVVSGIEKRACHPRCPEK